MKKSKKRKFNLKNLTPKKAFEKYAGTSEEVFISNFNVDRPPVTDIEEMCKVYTKDIPGNEDTLFTTQELNYIEGLLTEHLLSYVESKGGMEKLDLYTEEELDMMIDLKIEFILEYLRNNRGKPTD